jgi:Na+/H+ antiporter NhaC
MSQVLSFEAPEGAAKKAVIKHTELKKNVLLYALLIAAFIVVGVLVPDSPKDFGIISLLPAAFLIIYIFRTKRIVESLTLAIILCCIMGYKLEFFSVFNEILVDTMMDADMAWLIVVCGLMGSIVAVIEKNGGGYAFGTFVSSKAKTEKSSLLWTSVCSLLLSVDDYLNALTTGSAMTPVNDRHRIPREMTAYIVDSTAAPACVLNPISTWAVFIGGLMVANGLAEPGQQIITYLKTIPYNFYAIGTMVVMYLVILGVIPKFGPMKQAYERVAAGGPLAPAGSEKIDIRAGEEMEVPENPRLINFFAPMIVLIGSTILFGFDMQKGVLATIAFCFLFFIFQGMTAEAYIDEVLRGLKNMLMPLTLMVLAFSFADACERIGFMDFVVSAATSNITLQFLPFTIYIVFAFTEFIMGINWGMYIIAMPIVVPVTVALGGDPLITVGAVAAAGVWGSHCCFYSDATILTSASTGCDNFRHAITQIPFGAIGGVLAGIGYLILGFVIY